MEPLLDAGVHQLNPLPNFNRYPNAVDITAAKASAAAVPEPSSLVLAGSGTLGLVILLRRHRRRGRRK
jgi:hypothetical protein